MLRAYAIALCLLLPGIASFAQEDSTSVVAETPPAPIETDAGISHRVFRLNLPVDAAITLPATAWTYYAFPKIYGKTEIDSVTVATLDKNKIPAFDRWAVRSSDKAAAVSDYFLYGSIPYPLILLADRKVRKEAASVGAMYWEALAITGLLYTGGDYLIDRYRPETYDVTKKFSERMSGNEKNAFFAGHVSLVATSTFFTASIYDHFHPDSKWKWAFYGVAIAATGATAYLRHRAGKHFPSDIVVGTLVGVGSGLLVPRFHKYREGKKRAWMLMPTVGDGAGLSFVYKL